MRPALLLLGAFVCLLAGYGLRAAGEPEPRPDETAISLRHRLDECELDNAVYLASARESKAFTRICMRAVRGDL